MEDEIVMTMNMLIMIMLMMMVMMMMDMVWKHLRWLEIWSCRRTLTQTVTDGRMLQSCTAILIYVGEDDDDDDDDDEDDYDDDVGEDVVRFPNPHYVVGWGTEPLQRG